MSTVEKQEQFSLRLNISGFALSFYLYLIANEGFVITRLHSYHIHVCFAVWISEAM